MRTVATAGHVDHGKSTLLSALTGMEPDRWEEERRRGLSIDLGFVWCRLGGGSGGGAPREVTVAFVDVPGHERFVGNMLAGAGGVRQALFVVAADDGWQEQTSEHLEILDLLDVPAAAVAVTKADVAGTDRALEVAADTERRLAGTSLAGAPIVVTDAVSGRGIDELAGVLARRVAGAPPAPDRGRPRLWLDRSFTIAGAGTVVTGTLAGGRLEADGPAAALLPSGRPVRIRGLHSLGEPVDAADPGARVAVNLGGVDHEETGRGEALVAGGPDPAGGWVVTDALDATLRALPGTGLGRRGAWLLHAGTAETAVEIIPLLDDPITDRGPARLRLDEPLPLQAGDRFVIRDTGRDRTAGGGLVLDPEPPAAPRGDDQRLARAAALEDVARATGDAELVRALVAAAGGARAARRARAAAGVGPGPAPDGLTAVGDWLVEAPLLERWEAAVVERLEAEHAAARSGLDRTTLAGAVTDAGGAGGSLDGELAAAVVDHLADAGGLARSRATYLLPEHAGEAERRRRDRAERLRELLGRDPFAPPRLDEATEEAGVDYGQLQQLIQAGEVVRCGELGFLPEAVTRAAERLVELEREVGAFTAAQAKEAWGTTRKYAIPLLEHLDARGITSFDGTYRRVVGTPGGGAAPGG